MKFKIKGQRPQILTVQREYRGVTYVGGKTNPWKVQLRHEGYTFAATCATAIEAALAYDDIAYDLRGERAKLNFPEIR